MGSSSNELPVPARVTHWLHEQEDRFRFVAFECDNLPEPWEDFAFRQADLALFVAPPGAEPCTGSRVRRIFSGNRISSSTAKALVRLHDATTTLPQGTARWLDRFPVNRHHHLRVDRPGDFARVARSSPGRSTAWR